MALTAWAAIVGDIVRDNAERAFVVDAIDGKGSLTYGAFMRRAAGIAEMIEARGLQTGARIGIDLPNGLDFATLYFAALLGGFIAVPINNALSVRDKASILSGARIAARIIAPGAGPQEGSEAPVIELEQQISTSSDADVAARVARIDDERLLSIHFTSGTTNVPKGVPHRVGALLGNADSFNRAFGLGRDNRFVHVMPMGYMAGFLNTLLGAFTARAMIILAPQFSARSVLHFWESVVEHSGDMIWVSPTMLATLTQIDRGTLGADYCRSHTVRMFSATAPLSLKVRKEFEAKYGVTVIESYGLSELLLLTANLGPSGSKDGAVGRTIADADVEIRDEAGQKLPCYADGDIFVRSPHTTVGYLDYATGEPAPLADPWFDTGDVGHLDADGDLFVTGRRKDLIIRGGFNVSPRQIEEVLLSQPGVEGAAVVGAPHDYYGEEIVAALVLDADRSLSDMEAVLRAACRRDLGPIAVPDRFVAFAALPVNNIGKVQKAKVRERIIAGGGQ
jgi:acyl-CoA synthetase (AMP-forming)/AMP-acid ligase II